MIHKGAPTNFQRVYTELDLQYGFLKESSVIPKDIFEIILKFSRHAAAAQAAVEDFAAINPASSNTLALEEQPTTIGYAGSNDDITLAGGSDVEKHWDELEMVGFTTAKYRWIVVGVHGTLGDGKN